MILTILLYKGSLGERGRLFPCVRGWSGCVPKGPRGERRPADTVACAVAVARVATGEIEEELQQPSGKVRSGKAGAKARSEILTSEERQAIAKKAAAARWN